MKRALGYFLILAPVFGMVVTVAILTGSWTPFFITLGIFAAAASISYGLALIDE